MNVSALKHAESFRDLIVYQRSRQLQREVKNITMSFPKDERFSLTDQIRRSSRSIGANLAEAWAKRRYEKHFISKLTDADGEHMETQHWYRNCPGRWLHGSENERIVDGEMPSNRAMFNGMMNKAEMFCGEPPHTVREDALVYIAESDGKDPDD